MSDALFPLLNDPTIVKWLILALGAGVIWLAIKGLQRRVLIPIPDPDHRYRAKKLSGFLGALLTGLLIASVFHEKLGGLTVAFGVAGAGIAFALQEVITSFAGWLAILFGGFYKTGDRVQLGGIVGDVMDIGVLRTTLMETGKWVEGDLYNGRMVLVANSFVFKEPVYNYSGEFPFLWDEIKLPIHFGSDYDLSMEILEKSAYKVLGDTTALSMQGWKALQKKFKLEDAQTKPMVSLEANDNWVELTLRYIVHFRQRRTTKTALFREVLQSIEASGGKVRMASATFHLVEAPDINVRIRKD